MSLRDRPDRSDELRRRLARISARLRLRELLEAVALSVAVATLVAVTLRGAGLGLGVTIALATVVLVGVVGVRGHRARTHWSSVAAARQVEASRGSARNVVITAEELLRHPDRAAPSIRQRVVFEAAGITGAMRAAEIVPLGGRIGLAVAALLMAGGIVAGVPGRVAGMAGRALEGATDRARSHASRAIVKATIVAPAYTKETPRTLEEPERIEALQGSHLTLTVPGDTWRMRFGNEALATKPSDGATIAQLPLSRSGYIAIEPVDPKATATGRLLPISVVPDRSPSIRVEKPGKDLLLPTATSVVDVAATASDDFGLDSLELRYTKVSGSGEQFEFQEGTVPLSIARHSGRDWKAQAALALSRMGLAPGDAMIYRVVGRDARPGEAGFASSDSYFIEIAGPGQVALAGFELPPDRERYALSQQMIVLKLERLRAKERTLDRAALEHEVGNIAAEQRAVRANFVFLMGGEIEDEEAEAEHSHEIQEGRLENTARREIVDAIQHMGKVGIGLAAMDTAAALPAARAAVEALQRAFGRNRYILRTLPVRSRIDPSRRLSGDLSRASDWRRDLIPLPPDAAAEAARGLLARLLDLAPAIASGQATPTALTALAEDALAIDAAAEDWQIVSRGLTRLRDSTGTPADRAATLNSVIGRVSAALDRSALSARPAERNRALRSAWAEERRP